MAGFLEDGAAPKTVEGIRALPWLQAARRGNAEHLNCGSCRTLDVATRRAIRCGWESVSDSGRAWHPFKLGGPPLTVCAGYTSQMPDVVDVARAFLHWEKGQLQLRNPDPPPQLLDGIEILSMEINAQQAAELSDG